MEVEPILLETEKHPPLVSKFMDEMLPTKLFFHPPKDLYGRLWVFWSHNTLKRTSINCHLQNRIKSALSYYYQLRWADGLVQFWAAEEIRGQLHLTTTLQPFALSPNEKLMEYRKHCVKEYKLLVQEEESAGIVGRVFRNQLPEFGQQLRHYSVSEYPQRDFALSCGINSTIALPVFEPSGQTCVGVLELLLAHKYDYPLFSLLKWVSEVLEKQRLSTNDVGLVSSRIRHKEIVIALEQVCKTYNLPLGATWVRSTYISTSKKPQVSFQGELLVPCSLMSFSASGSFLAYNCNTPLRGHQGLVGKTFSSGNLHFCKDVSKLSITEYPQVLVARRLGIAACFAVCLRNISTGNQEFVIEFSLSREMTIHNSPDLPSLLNSILDKMEQHLISFEVITGDRRIEIFTEVHKASDQNNNDLTSYMAISTPTTSEGDSFQSLRTTECSMNSTCRQPAWPSCKRVYESDQFISESSFPVNRSAQIAQRESSGGGNSETDSTKWMNVHGYTLYAKESNIPILNQSRTQFLHSGAPPSEASAVVADVEMMTDAELMTIKVSHREKNTENIIKFDMPPTSSYGDLMENILIRWGFLKDKDFVIRYLNDSREPILLATDSDLHECMSRIRLRSIKRTIRMLIQVEDDRQDVS